jgi:hypothetical protein
MSDETAVETTEQTETVEATQETKAEKIEAKMYPESYVKKIHTENAARRKREEELSLKLKEYEDKELAAETDLKKKAEALEKRIKDTEAEYAQKLSAADKRYIRAEVRAAAIKAGIIDADDVNSIDLSDLRIDDEGNVTGVDELMAAHKERKPHWFKGERKPDEKVERKVTPVTPQRKTGESSTDYATLGDDDWRKKMQSMGVSI